MFLWKSSERSIEKLIKLFLIILVKIKSQQVKLRMLNDEEFDDCFVNNTKYNYAAVTKPNSVLAKFLSKHDGDRFCLNCFADFSN